MTRIFVNDNVPVGARGMARYFGHALHGLIDHFGDQIVVFSPIARDYHPANYLPALHFKGSEQLGLHDQLATWAVWRTRSQVLYSAWFNAIRASIPQAIVIYDLIYERFPQYHSWKQTPLRNLARERQNSLERADIIVAISQSTARDIVTDYPRVDPARIRIIPLGVEPLFFTNRSTHRSIPERPYLLYVGSRTGHKNFLRLLEAYGRSGLARDFALRMVSALPCRADEQQLIDRHQLSAQVQWIPSASDTELRTQYAEAAAFVYPSEYEGFGLPILEAMAAGTVVVTSNVSSMPEIGGSAALYFNPYDIDSLAAQLQAAVELSAAERQQRLEEGQARARSFTWEQCQQKTVSVLEELLMIPNARS
jgi:glycosyltransferase involved in cell wall biosynthesis